MGLTVTAAGMRTGVDQWEVGSWIGPTPTRGLPPGKTRGGTERKLTEVPTEGMAGPSTLIGPLAERGVHHPETEQALCLAGLGLRLRPGELQGASTLCQPRISATTRAGTSA